MGGCVVVFLCVRMYKGMGERIVGRMEVIKEGRWVC